MGLDKRIGGRFLRAGPAYGGSCFPKDTKAIISTADKFKTNLSVIKSVIKSNENRSNLLLNRVYEILDKKVKNKKITFLGVTFKPNTDDIREAPSIDIARFLLGAGAKLVAHDPVAANNFSNLFSDSITFSNDSYIILEDCDALIINTEWSEYKQPDFSRIKNLMKSPVIFDGRNLYNKQKMKDIGFYYSNIGFQPENEQF